MCKEMEFLHLVEATDGVSLNPDDDDQFILQWTESGLYLANLSYQKRFVSTAKLPAWKLTLLGILEMQIFTWSRMTLSPFRRY